MNCLFSALWSESPPIARLIETPTPRDSGARHWGGRGGLLWSSRREAWPAAARRRRLNPGFAGGIELTGEGAEWGPSFSGLWSHEITPISKPPDKIFPAHEITPISKPLVRETDHGTWSHEITPISKGLVRESNIPSSRNNPNFEAQNNFNFRNCPIRKIFMQ